LPHGCTRRRSNDFVPDLFLTHVNLLGTYVDIKKKKKDEKRATNREIPFAEYEGLRGECRSLGFLRRGKYNPTLFWLTVLV
jgi:hypothetical protein